MVINETIKIPARGHLLQTASEEFTEYEAFEKVQQKLCEYTVAKRDAYADNIKLVWHWYECVNCFESFQTPGNREQNEDDNEDDGTSFPPLENCSFLEWALQIALPGFEYVCGDYVFRAAPEKGEIVTCPHCNHAAHSFERQYCDYWVYSDSRLTMVTRTLSLSNRSSCNYSYMKKQGEPRDSPKKAQLTFNHENRQTYFRITDEQDKEIKHIHLDNQYMLKNHAIQNHINNDTSLKKLLISAFAQFYVGDFPFEINEITLDTLILINRFRGYPKDFYSAIPFSENSLKSEDSFSETADMLMAAQYADIDAVYRHFGLPEKKSIRRIIYQNPALVFYANEILRLPFRNTDILQQILSSEIIYSLLSKLHTFPGIITLISDKIESAGEINAWMFVKKMLHNIEYAAGMYLISAPKNQLRMLRRKSSDAGYDVEYGAVLPYSLPIPRKGSDISSDKIGDYDFIAPKSTFELDKAGRELHNCLVDYRRCGRQVIIVKKDSICVAAIEINKDEVVQALLKMNEPIEDNEELYCAFKIWTEKHGVTYSS